MDRAGEIFHVSLAEDVSIQNNLALNLGEREVVASAGRGDVPVHLVRGKVTLVGGEMHLYRAGDGIQVNITVGSGYVGS